MNLVLGDAEEFRRIKPKRGAKTADGGAFHFPGSRRAARPGVVVSGAAYAVMAVPARCPRQLAAVSLCGSCLDALSVPRCRPLTMLTPVPPFPRQQNLPKRRRRSARLDSCWSVARPSSLWPWRGLLLSRYGSQTRARAGVLVCLKPVTAPCSTPHFLAPCFAPAFLTGGPLKGWWCWCRWSGDGPRWRQGHARCTNGCCARR
jgi:hypothetical protein